MVTTFAPPRPLRAGPIPAVLWTALLLRDLAMSIVVFGLGVPILARMYEEPRRMMITGLVAYVVLLIVALLSRWARRAVLLRTPGALRSYSWSDPDAGPTVIDGIVAAVRGLAMATAVVMLTAAIDPTDPPVSALILFTLGGIGGYGLVVGLWDTVRIMRDRLPGWNRELLRPGLVMLAPAAMATAPLLTTPPSDARGIGGAGWILAAGVAVVMRAVTNTPLSRPERSIASGIREDAGDLTDALAEMVLSRTNPAPTLAHRRKIVWRIRAVLWAAAGVAALLLAFSVLL